ncbi:L-threonylcarbamoyladenylate synthase [Gardnerella pickettii]|uniref:L-threonylcarbamoyladenylate synthase n=4 Tax=Gardnerella TaxID=2701 RepID=T2PK88_9BIFI|nr:MULTISPECIES: L-threonylcarbamoyladenylate synthase [Gardnerella]MDK6472664.1 L-threonylcarbamoyladenylate synthase [Bifidobacterium sp. UMB9259]MDK7784923.1 L-threonylcarbamoyladenylate synthase [Bifidobacterium sp. UMB6791B]MDK8249110.1 L-threonylcarbamoyladenylate synthase [Bifidobacterium sp. UMB6794B]MDK8635578.1 L-threonylcarbamoyladenylate synthase [Bifidobacterium sp. UMB6791A]PMC45205.1 threonylcarbamoyl-AMP synthase [Peptoniphilus lacrimalis]RFT42631.1 Sua5/YciO/YrdC/YwlC family 
MSKICTINEESLQLAAQIINAGGVIVVPTDTVYGVACDPFNEAAVAKIYQLKRRPRTKALQILMSSVSDLEKLGLYLPNPLDVLAEKFLPGGYSPIARAKKDSVATRLATLCKADESSEQSQATQGVRVPDCPELMKILRVTGPLAASSANRSGNESADSVEEAFAAFGDEIPLYLNAGPTRSHVASTVVGADARDKDGIVILREGVISEEQIRAESRKK